MDVFPLNHEQVVFGQKLAEQGVLVEACGLVEMVDIACSGFFRVVQGWEMVSLFIPGCRVIKGYFLTGFYSKLSFGKGYPPFFRSLCFSVLKKQDIFYAVFLCAEISAWGQASLIVVVWWQGYTPKARARAWRVLLSPCTSRISPGGAGMEGFAGFKV